MWIRVRFDIAWRDLFAAVVFCLLPFGRKRATDEVVAAWSSRSNVLVTRSVRSGFDLLLRAVNLPRGSEVLFTALTVPDMVAIAHHHGLRAVPVDIDDRGEIDIDSLQHRLSSQTRMLVVAHLYGNRQSLDHLRRLLSGRDIIVVEDAAQSLTQIGDGLDASADVIMHSFGPIKTSTALAGGIVETKDAAIAVRMSQILRDDSVATRLAFFTRVLRFGVLKMITHRPFATLFFRWMRWRNLDPDAVMVQMGKGCAGNGVQRFRSQPSVPLLRLMARRFRHFDRTRIQRRIEVGRELCRAVGRDFGKTDAFWAFSIRPKARHRTIKRLREQGFDAAGATRMRVVSGPLSKSMVTHEEQRIFLPCYPELTNQALSRLAKLLQATDLVDQQSERGLQLPLPDDPTPSKIESIAICNGNAGVTT